MRRLKLNIIVGVVIAIGVMVIALNKYAKHTEPEPLSMKLSDETPRKLQVYVYDLPAEISGAGAAGSPSWRGGCRTTLYGAEQQFLDSLSGDLPDDIVPIPEGPRAMSADYYVVPVHSTCISILNGRWSLENGREAVKNAFEYVRLKYPYWNASFGADHVFVMTHDAGREYAPPELRNAIVLTHTSQVVDYDWLAHLRLNSYEERQKIGLKNESCYPDGELCTGIVAPPSFNPWRDLAIPTVSNDDIVDLYRSPKSSSFGEHRKKNYVYFRGTVRIHSIPYSWGIRQELKLRYANDDRIKIHEGGSAEYASEVLNSTFCLSVPGNAMWSPRLFDAILLGCIPLILTDGTQLPFHPVVDWRKFSVRHQRSVV